MEIKRYLTVTAINRYLSAKIDADINLKNMPIQGEISNARISKGHLYFVLKDEESEISAIMFQNNVQGLNFTPKDGMKVIVKASLQLYEKRGTYSLLVYEMKEFGLGLLYQEFLKLKEKLSKEGLFSDEHKKAIPEYPTHIGLITSSTADAMHDVISTINKRFPIAEIYLYPALVQGTDAPKSLIKAINKMNEDSLCEVCIIARGGGSFEDLSCFNDEELARVIYDSTTPIVSGVGHEADYTICDFVSDFRAPTPTGAAVRVSKDKAIILNNLRQTKIHLNQMILKTIDNKNHKLEILKSSHYLANFIDYLNKIELKLASEIDHLNSNSPLLKINKNIDNLEFLKVRLNNSSPINKINDYLNNINDKVVLLKRSTKIIIKGKEDDLNKSIDKLVLVNPLNLMKKGYSLVYKGDELLTTTDNINVNDEVTIKMSDGEVNALVKKINKGQ